MATGVARRLPGMSSPDINSTTLYDARTCCEETTHEDLRRDGEEAASRRAHIQAPPRWSGLVRSGFVSTGNEARQHIKMGHTQFLFLFFYSDFYFLESRNRLLALPPFARLRVVRHPRRGANQLLLE